MNNEVSDKTMKTVIDSILSMPIEEPKLYFTYPKDKPLTRKQFTEWVKMVSHYKSCAEHFEEQERGAPLSVDRATVKYFRPACSKMFDYITKYGFDKD